MVDDLVGMGCSNERRMRSAGRRSGGNGDKGIDGIIKEDRLGLDLVYLQAKRWKGTVGRPKVQKFVGALHGKRAKKGVFITTGKFSDDATRYVETIDPKVILIDRRMLAELTIDHGLGTTTTATFQLKRIDSDYFTQEEVDYALSCSRTKSLLGQSRATNDYRGRPFLRQFLPPLPRWHRLRISPQPYPASSCSRFQFFENHIPRRILPIPPTPAFFDERVIDVSSIRQSTSAMVRP